VSTLRIARQTNLSQPYLYTISPHNAAIHILYLASNCYSRMLGAVGRGTALQARRSGVRFTVRSMEFSWFIMRNEYQEYLRSTDPQPSETLGICPGLCKYSFTLLRRMILS
jgi:hypothetical protein